MFRDAVEWIKGCKNCILRKSPTNIRTPLISIETLEALELVCFDYLSLETSKGWCQNILVSLPTTSCAMMLLCQLLTRQQKPTAEVFFSNFVVHIGLPKRIHSDQGANFESKIIKELCNLCGIAQSRTAPYHPMGSGLTERFTALFSIC